MLILQQIPVLTDNYVYIIHDEASKQTVVIDPAESQAVIHCLKTNHWTLDFIFNTHHHPDHVGANLTLKQQTHCQIIGAEADKHRIPAIDKTVKDGDILQLGKHTIQVISTAGHTSGHIVFYFEQLHWLFCGDTLFSQGCGRLFEGTAEQMLHSLNKIKQLPAKTKIYCAHEYTQTNAEFTLSLEPNSLLLQQTLTAIKTKRGKQQATIPTLLAHELKTNPFLRANNPDIKKALNKQNASELEVFTEIRDRKDHW